VECVVPSDLFFLGVSTSPNTIIYEENKIFIKEMVNVSV
jgi:hypothetical protein